MNVNPMIIPTLALSAALCAVGIVLGRRVSSSWKAAALLLGACAAAAPGALMTLYYAHLFDSWRGFYEFRALRGSELSAAGLGLLLGLGIRYTSGFGRVRFLVWPGLVLVTLLIILVPYAKPFLVPAHYDAFRDKWDGRVCLQSTGSSCGAASAATVFRQCGINVTERELARECYTCATGTESWYLARAFRKRGLAARFITQPPAPDPLPVPCIAGIRLGVIGHFIAILEDRDGAVVTGDPRIGAQEYSRDALVREVDFTGFFLAVEAPPSLQSPAK